MGRLGHVDLSMALKFVSSYEMRLLKSAVMVGKMPLQLPFDKLMSFLSWLKLREDFCSEVLMSRLLRLILNSILKCLFVDCLIF